MSWFICYLQTSCQHHQIELFRRRKALGEHSESKKNSIVIVIAAGPFQALFTKDSHHFLPLISVKSVLLSWIWILSGRKALEQRQKWWTLCRMISGRMSFHLWGHSIIALLLVLVTISEACMRKVAFHVKCWRMSFRLWGHHSIIALLLVLACHRCFRGLYKEISFPCQTSFDKVSSSVSCAKLCLEDHDNY